MNIFKEAVNLQEKNIPFAIATIISSKGSTPRNVGKMLIKEDSSIIGTIGGGLAEAYTIQEAVKAIQEKKSKIIEYKLDSLKTDGIHMQCGGELTIFIEVVSQKPKIIIIGAGHVGYALAEVAHFANYQVIVADDRKEFANKDRYPMALEVFADPDIEKAVENIQIDNNSYIVIATKDSDEKVLRKLISSKAAYIGMIGSRRKVALVMNQLKKEGVSEERINFVHAPIGLDIGSETPEEIAISILSEIMKVKSSKSGLSFKEL